MRYKRLLSGVQNQLKANEDNLSEYKEDFLRMNIGSLNAIMRQAESILKDLENPEVRNNLTYTAIADIVEPYKRRGSFRF